MLPMSPRTYGTWEWPLSICAGPYRTPCKEIMPSDIPHFSPLLSPPPTANVEAVKGAVIAYLESRMYTHEAQIESWSEALEARFQGWRLLRTKSVTFWQFDSKRLSPEWLFRIDLPRYYVVSCDTPSSFLCLSVSRLPFLLLLLPVQVSSLRPFPLRMLALLKIVTNSVCYLTQARTPVCLSSLSSFLFLSLFKSSISF